MPATRYIPGLASRALVLRLYRMLRVPDKLTIGSRGSKLAMTQSRWVADELRRFHPKLEVDIVEIKTSGDKNLGVSLSAFGGKGAFTKELEDAILAGRCDIAVHSLKDLPTTLHEGLGVLCTPKREDTADVLIARSREHVAKGLPLPLLALSATVGTSSLRRRAQLASLRPDVQVVEFRGNVDTRLARLREGKADGCILAVAGVSRLGLVKVPHPGAEVDGMPCMFLLPPAWLPAAGQGALGIEGRAGDARIAKLLAPLNDSATMVATRAERAFLQALGVGCQAPVAALATVAGDALTLTGRVLSADGKAMVEHTSVGKAADPDVLGKTVAAKCG